MLIKITQRLEFFWKLSSGALPGSRGPLHKAFSDGMPAYDGGSRQQVPTYLSYVDNGDLPHSDRD